MEQFERTLHQEVKADGGTSLAKRMGVNETRLLDCANPNRENHRMSIELFGQVLAHLPEDARRRVLGALLEEFGYGLVSRAVAPECSPLQALVDLVAESADVTRAVHDALEDGRITSTEHFKIRREIGDVRNSLDSLEALIKIKVA
ncbi:phage regulatory CII family protein [Pseudomonas sp. NPDC078700]|uniref:phage regulatory CII family protein n=1 Tax=Pseudomonas sp. NPDC078700 TaxID=3364424 RepID=UPI0037C51943